MELERASFSTDRAVSLTDMQVGMSVEHVFALRVGPSVNLFVPIVMTVRARTDVHPRPRISSDLADRFRALAQAWRKQTGHLSSPRAKLGHPSYLRILALGRDIAPLLLEELDRGDWFETLDLLFPEASPISPEDAGDVRAMAQAWRRWGHAHGYS